MHPLLQVLRDLGMHRFQFLEFVPESWTLGNLERLEGLCPGHPRYSTSQALVFAVHCSAQRDGHFLALVCLRTEHQLL